MAYASTILSTLISFLYTPIMLRMLGQSEFGLYSLSMATVNYLSVLSFGFGSAYVKFFAQYRIHDDDEGVAVLNGMYMTIFSVIGFLTLVLGGILVANTENIYGSSLAYNELVRARIVMSIMVVNLAVSFPCNILNSYLIANERFIFQRIWGLVAVVASPVLSLLLLLLGLKSIAMAFLALLLTLVTAAVRYFYCKEKLSFRCSFRKFDKAIFKKLSSFSALIFINILADQVNWSIDKILLGIYQGTTAVAVYAVAASLNQYFRYSVITGLSVFETKVSLSVVSDDSNEVFTNLVARSGRISFVLLSLLLSGFVFFGKDFIVLYYGGESYRDAYYIAILLMAPSLIPLVVLMGAMVQEAKNKHKYRTLIYSITACGNLLLSIPLSKMYSGIGCAAATAVAVIVGDCIFMNLIYHYKVGINMVFVFKQVSRMLPALLAPLLFGCFALIYIDITKVSVLFLLMCTYAVIYCISFWLFGMNEEEKDFVKKPVSRLRNIVGKRECM